jgi:hypothetical protein
MTTDGVLEVVKDVNLILTGIKNGSLILLNLPHG